MAKQAFNKAVVNKSKKGTRIKNKTELVKFLNAYGVAKQMKFFASLLFPNNYKFKLHFSVGEASYTDFKDITIGIPEYMIGRTKEEIISDAKWRTAHESGHLIYSDKDAYQGFIKDFVSYMKKTHQINENISQQVASHLVNCIEDGREEHFMVLDNPGLLKFFTFGRGLWWYNCETKEVESGQEVQRELMDTLFCVASLSTMGTLPKGYADVWGERDDLFDMIKKMKVSINRYVNNPDAVKAIDNLWTLVNTIEDWMVNLMKQIPEPDLKQMMKKLQQQAGANGSPLNQASGSAGQGQNNNSQSGQGQNGNGQGSGNNQTNPIHKSFADGEDEKSEGDDTESTSAGDSSGNGGRIDYVEDEDDTSFDTNMDKIVEEAIRERTEEMIEDEYDSVIQAEWDDMLHESQIGEEDEGQYDEEAAKEIEEYYDKLDRNKRGGRDWAVDFKVRKYNYDIEQTPTSVRLEAKKLNKEFAEIFLNKRAINAKNLRRGRLNEGDLYKFYVNDMTMFKKKGTPRDTDYVFYLLMDGSGSMYGKKFTEALRACSLVEEALKGIAPVKIVMFDYDGNVNHRIIKDFKQKSKTGNYSWTFANHQGTGSCNMDGYSIRVAAKELAKRHESRKILITLSDGLPNGPANYTGTRGENDVSEAVTSARNDGISLFNIYFAESASERSEYLPGFKKMYKEKGIISCAPKDIGHELLRVIKRELRK